MSDNVTDTLIYSVTCLGWMWQSRSNECCVEGRAALNSAKNKALIH